MRQCEAGAAAWAVRGDSVRMPVGCLCHRDLRLGAVRARPVVDTQWEQRCWSAPAGAAGRPSDRRCPATSAGPATPAWHLQCTRIAYSPARRPCATQRARTLYDCRPAGAHKAPVEVQGVHGVLHARNVAPIELCERQMLGALEKVSLQDRSCAGTSDLLAQELQLVPDALAQVPGILHGMQLAASRPSPTDGLRKRPPAGRTTRTAECGPRRPPWSAPTT